MIFKLIDLKANSTDASLTEIMFEIAGARADGCELIRFNMINNETKLYDGIIKQLKGLKQKGLIQFFATADSFASSSTEASFLINKYQANLSLGEKENGEVQYIYVKI